MRRFFGRRVLPFLLDLLRQGITAEKIALSVALGAAIGVFPVLGSTTLLCVIAAAALRLNPPAIQLVNYLVYPVQLALLIPFMQLGAMVFGGGSVELGAGDVLHLIRTDLRHAVLSLWTVTMHAIAAWCIAVPAPAVLSYFALRAVLRRAAERASARGEA